MLVRSAALGAAAHHIWARRALLWLRRVCARAALILALGCPRQRRAGLAWLVGCDGPRPPKLLR
eukprot:2673479-Alexandrium_andersonii.AAC.1